MSRNVLLVVLLSIFFNAQLFASDDAREYVQLPEMMQNHMLANMRDHLEVINQILLMLSNDQLDEAADIAEAKLGMSSLSTHGAAHMAKFMPKGMQQAGTAMHHSASRFALKAQEGDAKEAYKALTQVTTACVGCHT
ncbi:MAG: hypothetical protein ACWA5R_10385, partial [bacterium]